MSLKALSNVKKGCQRDKDILETISICRVMNTDQLTELFFKFPTGKRKCQARMKSLYERKMVNKFRLSLDTSTIYYLGKFPGQPEHSLAISWIHVWFKRKQGEKVLTWETEQLKEFGFKCDALCSTKIAMTNEIRWYCIEFDRGSVSNHPFKKVSLYDGLYQREGFPQSKLMKRLGDPLRFPKVIIVSDSIKSGQKIKQLITDSPTKVRYDFHMMSEIRLN